MKHNYFKLILIAILAMTLPACAIKERAQQAELNYNGNYGGYLAAKSDCRKDNNHEIKFIPEGATAPVEMKLKAGDCNDIEKPQHGGEYVAQAEVAYINAGGNIVAAGINGLVNYEVSKDNNRTRVDIAELQNEREAAENAVLVEAIGSRDSQTEAITALTVSVTEQNETLVDLVATLTDEEEGEESEEGEEGESEEGGEGES